MEQLGRIILNFIRSRNITSHTVVVAFGLFTAFLIADPAARDTFTSFMAKHPTQYLLYRLIAFITVTYKGSHTLEAQAANVGNAAKQQKEMIVDLSHDN